MDKIKHLYSALYVLCGAVLGSGVTYIIVRDKFEKIAQEEIDSVKAHYKKKNAELLEVVTELAPANQYPLFDPEADDGKAVAKPREIVDDRKATAEALKIVVENEYVSKSSIDMESLKEHFPLAKSTREDAHRPQVITYEQFAEEKPHFDKVTLTYYMEDDTLANESEEVIPDPNSCVGTDALGDLDEENMSIYVRNYGTSTDYEVVASIGAYSEVVLGMVPEKPHLRKMRPSDE